MALFHLNKKQHQKLHIFAVSIVVSFIAWCIFALSNNYLYRVPTSVQYINAPENKAFHPLQSDTVSLQVEGTGWQILFSKLRLHPQNIKVDLSGLKNRNWVMFSTQMGFINRQFAGNQRIINVSPDTLYFDFSKQTVKKVPVRLVSNLEFKKQYNIIDSIEIKPAYVTVTGPLEDLVLIEQWDTEPLVKKNVETTIGTRLPLAKKMQGNLTVYPTNVEVKIPIGETTEKIIEVPIRIENAQRGLSTILLPGKVSLTVNVPLKHYSEITRESFEAVVNLDNSNYKVTDLPVILTKSPEFCKVLRIEPQNINYILRR
jgi:YbbR domain-containing protein